MRQHLARQLSRAVYLMDASSLVGIDGWGVPFSEARAGVLARVEDMAGRR